MSRHVVIDGVEYVPRADVVPASDQHVAQACRVLCAWLYLRDKPGNAIWEALRHLSPNLNELAARDPEAAYMAARVACGEKDDEL